MATKVIAISNHKGGVGKTTSTVNIGAGLSINNIGNKSKQVLLIDLDPQSNLTQSLGVTQRRPSTGHYTVSTHLLL